jgi:hypothetical protein
MLVQGGGGCITSTLSQSRLCTVLWPFSPPKDRANTVEVAGRASGSVWYARKAYTNYINPAFSIDMYRSKFFLKIHNI